MSASCVASRISITELQLSNLRPVFGHPALSDWGLDPAITYLNHGTVGVVPLKVLEAQQQLRLEIERQPAQFMLRELADLHGAAPWGKPPRLRSAAEAVASFLGAHGEDFVFVDNATAGANAVLRSLRLEAGDEILVTDHGYGGITRAARYVARQAGATVIEVLMPPASATSEEIVEKITGSLGPRTKVAVIDHLGSGTARLLPIREIAEQCHLRGVEILADGAHVPGMLPLDIPSLSVDWYVGNLHKWAWAPRGTGFLWASKEQQPKVHPPVISWGLDEGFTSEFDWSGTRDPSGWLTAPFALDLMRSIGMDAIQGRNHQLAWQGAQLLCDRWGTTMEVDKRWFGSMVAVPLPEPLGSGEELASRLRDQLLFEDRIEVPIIAREGRLWARISVQVYTELSDIERLGDGMAARF